MLDFLRRSATSVFAWVILGALALAFGLSFGLPSDSLSFGSEKYVKVYGHSVGDEDFRYQLSLASRYGRIPREAETQKAYGAREEVLEGIVERLLFAHNAEQLGLGATQRQAEDLVLAGHVILFGFTLEFLAKDDKFNYPMFEANWLRPLGITEQRYLEYQRQEYLARAMRDVIHASAAVPEPELRALYDAQANQISLRYARYEAGTFGAGYDPTEADIDAYVQGHQDELTAQYGKAGNRFMKLGKQMRVYVIEVPADASDASDDGGDTGGSDGGDDGDETGAADEAPSAAAMLKAARVRIAGGEDFRVVARQISQHPSATTGGDLHWIGEALGTGLDPVVDEAARAAELDTVSEVLVGESSLYLIKVAGRREGDVPEADALRELAAEGARKARGSELAKAAAEADKAAILEGGKAVTEVFTTPDALDSELATALGTPIEDVPVEGESKAAHAKVAMKKTGLTPKGVPLEGLGGPAPELEKQAWADESGADLLDGVYAVGDDWVLAGVVSKVEGSSEEYLLQRQDLLERATRRQAENVATRVAERWCLEAKAKGDLVVSEQKVERLMTYDIKAEDGTDVAPDPAAEPYTVCQRVGGRGGVLTAGWKFAEWQ